MNNQTPKPPLGLLQDSSLGHGAFHTSSLNLPEQALQLIADKAI